MAILKIVYTEHDKYVQLYRDCDIETICRNWLDTYVAAQNTTLIFELTTAQELVLLTMQALLATEYKALTVFFYIGETLCMFDDKWHLDPYPDVFPSYEGKCLDLIWGL